jgi:hypothetical protein
MMSRSGFFKIYNINKIEFQKDVYKRYTYSVFYVNGNHIPSWYYVPDAGRDYDIQTVYLQELDKIKLSNKEISIINSTDISTGGYTFSVVDATLYADKQSVTLEDGKIYRLYLEDLDTDHLYSEIFKKIQT